MGNEEVEILRLSIEVMREGVLYCREFAFTSDNQVFMRVSCRDDDEECPWSTRPWTFAGLWKHFKDICILADKQKQKGWEVIWNPQYNPETAQYIKSVPWL